jgi:hypothetical protein
MAIDALSLTDNYEIRKETLKGYMADYKQLMADDEDLRGRLDFATFLKFALEFDRQQRLSLRRQGNVQ